MFIAVAGPVGVMITGTALLTGAIWGKPTWGAFWVWDARTTSGLVLFFLSVGLVALRSAIPRTEQASRAVAILAIVGTLFTFLGGIFVLGEEAKPKDYVALILMMGGIGIMATN